MDNNLCHATHFDEYGMCLLYVIKDGHRQWYGKKRSKFENNEN